MDPILQGLIQQQMPDINPDIANGYAVKEMSNGGVEMHVHEIFKCAAESFPEGLRYIDCEPVDPVKQYLVTTEPRAGSSTYEISRRDVFMMRYIFEYKGERIHKYMNLPFVRDGGLMVLRGTTYSISPVLADKGISLGINWAFVPVLRSRVKFKRVVWPFYAGNVEMIDVYIVTTRLHQRSAKKARENGQPPMNAESTVLHYLMGKYGLYDTFRKFFGVDVVVGYPDEVNEDNFPPFLEGEDELDENSQGWTVCHSKGDVPRAVRDRDVSPSPICLAVRNEDFKDIVIRSAIASFFYIVDHFPHRVNPEDLDGSVDECNLWRILLGKIIGGVSGGDGVILDDMKDHYDSLDCYIDQKSKADLREGDIYVDDLYELLLIVMEIVSQPIVQTVDDLSTMANKRLMVMRYVLSDVNQSIFWMLFTLNRKASQNKELTFNDVESVIKRQLSTDTVVDKLSNTTKHSEISTVSSPGDNKIFKITSRVVQQTDSGESRKRSKAAMGEEKYLHASIAEHGSLAALPKSEPTGRGHLNVMGQTNEKGDLVPRERHKDLLREVQSKISRK